MRLVACRNCHAQYDVSEIDAATFPCRCGETLENRPHAAVDAAVHRCGACGALVSEEAESCAYCRAAIVREPGSLSLICPECYARCAEASRFCTACGVAFRPEPVRVEGWELPCPVCALPMPPQQVGGMGLNECAKCHGLWVPGESFERLVNRAIEARRSADPQQLRELAPRVSGANPASQRVQYRSCPVCDAHMQRRNFRRSSGVIVDTCRSHGTWLDADELEQIAGFILAGGETAASLQPPEGSAAPLDPGTAAELARLRVEQRYRAMGPDPGSGLAGTIVDVLIGLLK